MTVFCHLYGSDKGRIQFMPGMSGYRAGVTEEKTWALALGDDLTVLMNRAQIERLVTVAATMESTIEAEEAARAAGVQSRPRGRAPKTKGAGEQ